MLSGDQSEAKLISGGTTCCSSLKTDRISPSKCRRKDAKVAMCCAMQGNTQLMAMLCLADLLGCGELLASQEVAFILSFKKAFTQIFRQE